MTGLLSLVNGDARKIPMAEGVVWVCWSAGQQMRDANRDTHIHLQGEGGKTLCGISCGPRWDYEVHENSNFVSCARCRKVSRARTAHAGRVSRERFKRKAKR